MKNMMEGLQNTKCEPTMWSTEPTSRDISKRNEINLPMSYLFILERLK